MFSIQLVTPNVPRARRSGLAQRLVGKSIGFIAGLTLIAGLDALFLDHVLWRSFSYTFALHQPTMTHAVRAAWTGLAFR